MEEGMGGSKRWKVEKAKREEKEENEEKIKRF